MAKAPDMTAEPELRAIGGLIGHRAALARSQARLAAGRFPPVLILSGMKGVGKGLLASTMAAGLFCDTADACGRCPGCRQVAAGEHPELLALYNRQGRDPAALINDDAKALQKFIALRPSQIGLSAGLRERLGATGLELAKVVIVEDFERFNAAAQNRLLKTLEEPPSYAHFILTTSEPEAVLATIRSRAQVERLHGLSREETAALLAELKTSARFDDGEFALLEALLSRHPLPLGYGARLIADYGEDFLTLLTLMGRCIHKGAQVSASERSQLAKIIKERKIPVLVLQQFFELELHAGYRQYFVASKAEPPSIGRLLYRRAQLSAIKKKLVATTNSQLVLETLLYGR